MRWTITKAAGEFGVNRETLIKRLNVADIPKAKDYSTKEICAAVFGSITDERLRLTREQADKIALENAEQRGELVNARDVQSVVERGLAAIVAQVNSISNLETEDKGKIINLLRQAGESVVGRAKGVVPAADLHGQPVE